MANIVKTDLCVIGAGSAGLTVAAGGAQMGARVVLIEKGEMGGDCLNFGCVPSKALLAAAHAAQAVRYAGRFGIQSCQPALDFAAVHAHVHGVIDVQVGDEDDVACLADGFLQERVGRGIKRGFPQEEVHADQAGAALADAFDDGCQVIPRDGGPVGQVRLFVDGDEDDLLRFLADGTAIQEPPVERLLLSLMNGSQEGQQVGDQAAGIGHDQGRCQNGRA